MPHFSNISEKRLIGCHPDLQTLFFRIVRTFDCSVIFGHRDNAVQFELFKKGRVQKNGIWVIKDQRKIVTYKDGYEKLSDHNYSPSKAVDVVPYPIDFNNMKRMRYFVGYVKGIARMLKDYGAIDNEIVTGLDWDDDTILTDQRMVDAPHFEVK